jgi:hypothetical protein
MHVLEIEMAVLCWDADKTFNINKNHHSVCWWMFHALYTRIHSNSFFFSSTLSSITVKWGERRNFHKKITILFFFVFSTQAVAGIEEVGETIVDIIEFSSFDSTILRSSMRFFVLFKCHLFASHIIVRA